MEPLCAGTGRSHVCLQERELQTVSGSRRMHADDERTWEVGQLHSPYEAAEQCRGTGSGSGGGKVSGHGERARAECVPDSGPRSRAQLARVVSPTRKYRKETLVR